jgi:ABC-type transport system substrate-binding protein
MRLTRRQFLAATTVAPISTQARVYGRLGQPLVGLRLAGPVAGLSTLDPALTRDLQAMTIVRQIFRGLLKFNASLEPVSDLGELVEQSADLRSYTFKLRDGAAFADGREMTAQNVIASFTRALSPSIAGGRASALAATAYLGDIAGASDVIKQLDNSVSGLREIDSKTLMIELEQPSATFLIRLASVPTSIVDVSEASDGSSTWWYQPNATGPFAVAEITDSLIRIQPNTSYVGVVPDLEVSFLLGASASNPLNLFQDDDIDLIAGVSGPGSTQLQDPASTVDAVVGRTPLFATSYIALGNSQPPLDDIHIRRALQFLVSQSLVAESTYAGTVNAATGIIPNGMLGRDWTSSLGPDIEQARAEIASSTYGTADEVPVIRVYAADIESVETLRDLALAELGLKVEAIEVRWDDFLSGLVERRFPAYGLYWGADYPDPEAILGMLFHSSGSDNYTGYVNPAFDAILNTARSVADIDDRAALYQQAQDLLIEDAAVIPLYFDVGVTIARPGIVGLEVTPLGMLGLESVTSVS